MKCLSLENSFIHYALMILGLIHVKSPSSENGTIVLDVKKIMLFRDSRNQVEFGIVLFPTDSIYQPNYFTSPP